MLTPQLTRGTCATPRKTTAPVAWISIMLLLSLVLPLTWQAAPAAAQTVSRVEYVGTADYDFGEAVALDGSGNVYVAGQTWGSFGDFTNAGDLDGFLRKYTTSGEAWTVQFGTDSDDNVAAVDVDGAGNVYVAGHTSGAFDEFTNEAPGSWDAFVRKYDPEGILLWQDQFGTDDNDHAWGLAVTSSGDVYVAGSTYGELDDDHESSGYEEAFVRKYTQSTGTSPDWTVQFGGADGHTVAAAVAVHGTTVVVSGLTNGAFDGFEMRGMADAFVVTLTTEGVLDWTDQFGTTAGSYDYAWDVAVGPSDTIYVAARLGGEGVVRTYSLAGADGWEQSFGTVDSVRRIAVDNSGTAYVVGDRQVDGRQRGYLETVASDGTLGWAYQMDGGHETFARDVAVDGAGNAYIVGSVDGALTGTTPPYWGVYNAVLVVVAATQYTAPVVTRHPRDDTVTSGEPATFTATATGDPAPTVRWEESYDGGSTWHEIFGETSTTYVTEPTTFSMNGWRYRAVFDNEVEPAAVTDVATLTVNALAPVVTRDPTDVTVVEGSSASFTAAADGDPTPTVQWEKSTDDGANWASIDGETSSTYWIDEAALDMDGHQFRAVFTNEGDTVETDAATLTVTPAPPTVTNLAATVARGQITVTFDEPDGHVFECRINVRRGATWESCVSGQTFPARGAQTVSVRASDDDGETWGPESTVEVTRR